MRGADGMAAGLRNLPCIVGSTTDGSAIMRL